MRKAASDSAMAIVAFVVVLMLVVATLAVLSVQRSIPAMSYAACMPGYYQYGNSSRGPLCSWVTYSNIVGTPTIPGMSYDSCGSGKYQTGNASTGPLCSNIYYDQIKQIPLNASNGLVAYWNFNECQGNHAYDYSGNLNTGTLTNSPTWTTGKFGCGLNFVSTNSEYVSIASSSALNLPSDFTISVWVNFVSKTVDEPIIDKDYGSGGWMLWQQGDSNYLTMYIDGNNQFGSSIPTVSAGVWHLLTITNDGTTMRWYTDGAQITSGGTHRPTGNAQILAIGGSPIAGAGYFNGALDDVRIYNYAMTAAQIAQLDSYVPGV